jgi:hypothetical protein
MLQFGVAPAQLSIEDRGMPFDPREPIHVTVPGSPDDPRVPVDAPPGVIVHRVPELHPDDVTIFKGIPVTTPARTLVDLSEILSRDELYEAFESARELGLLDIDAVKASAARVEWRPTLEMLQSVIDEFA